MICPNCRNENKNTNIKCEFCSTQLIDVNDFNQQGVITSNGNIVETKEIKVSTKKVGFLSNILILIFVGPWLLMGIAFLGIGLFSSISEHNQTKGYEQTTAILKDYKNCTHDDGSELCEAIYEYQLNGITYSISPNLLSNRDGFDKSAIVYYNPNNPSESVMHAGWSILTIVGFIIVIVVIVIFVFKTILMKKILEGKDNITMNINKTN